jgi:hypothetical protein
VAGEPERLDEERQCGPAQQPPGERPADSVLQLARQHIGVTRLTRGVPEVPRQHLSHGKMVDPAGRDPLGESLPLGPVAALAQQ